MHIVFLDNGRKKIAADPVFAQVLQCVRCGALKQGRDIQVIHLSELFLPAPRQGG